MISDPQRQEQVTGWSLAAAVGVHVLLLRASAALTLAVLVVLAAGAIMRGRRVLAPRWPGRILLLLGTVAVVMEQNWWRPSGLLGELAAVAAVLMLLQPVTPGRGLRVLFCLLIMLTAAALSPFASIGMVFVVLDVVVMLFLAEQIHRPPEVAVSLWVSVMRSLRVAIPVAAVVSLVFWLFPSLSIFNAPAFTGFSGDGILDPGEIAGLAQSHRVAMVARFPESQPLPQAADLYWRGQVLEINEGLRWSRSGGRLDREKILQDVPPKNDVTVWKYSQEVTSNRGGFVPVLDHAVFVEAKRDGQGVAVLDQGAGALRAVGAGPLTLEVASSPEHVADAPVAGIGGSGLGVPENVRGSTLMRKLADHFVSPMKSADENLRSLAKYFREAGFRYTTHPGRVPDLPQFLAEGRKGFCEHYAAAAANLLRLGGVPARIVTGYRGGTWNPWLGTITVRDSDAHAWVEAWDGEARQWRRFDPTNYVAPELTARMEREMDSANWPWYRRAWGYGGTMSTVANGWLDKTMARITSSEKWELVQPIVSGLLVLAGLGWLVRNALRRRAARPQDLAGQLLADLEKRAARVKRERRSGETPLAWFDRLDGESRRPEEREILRGFAESYEESVYRERNEAGANSLRETAKQLRKIWRSGAKI